MSDPASIDDRLEAAAVKAEGASEIMRRFANDGEGVYIDTASGPIPSIAQWLVLNEEAVGDLTAVRGDVDELIEYREGIEGTQPNTVSASVVKIGTRPILDVIDQKVVTPEQYQLLGMPVGAGNAVYDTAAWKAAAAAMTNNTTFRARGEYLINGSEVVFPALFNWELDLRGAIFHQQLNLSKTITINNPLALRVRGGRFYGRGGAAGEYNGASSSYNGVAAIAVYGGDEVEFDGCYGREHAGGFIVCFGVIRQTFINIDDKGIGAPYIDPVGHADQGNGSDFSIMCQPLDNTLGWVYEYRFKGCRLRDHAFGVQAVQSKIFQWEDMDVGPCPGQHGLYGIELDGITVSGTNYFRKCYQGGFKQQYENYAGRFIGPAWQPSTSYQVGDVVRAVSILWVCKTAHVSPGAFAQTNWNVDPRFQRKPPNIQGVTFEDCGYDFLFVSSSLSDGREIYTRGGLISGIVSTGCVNGWSLDRLLDFTLDDININGGIRGIFGRDFSGTLRDITIRNTKLNGILLSHYGNVFYENVKLIDCGLTGADDAEKSPLLVSAPTASGIPSQLANPYVHAENIGYIFSSGDAAGAYLTWDADTRNRWEIVNTYGSTTTKKIRIDGSVIASERIHAPGFFAAAQNNPATFAGGMGPRDFHGAQNPQQASSTRPFLIGDRCWNTAVAASGTVGWVCTTAGSPGTWVRMAAAQAT